MRPRRAAPFPPNLAFPNPNLGSRFLVEQPEPVVRTFVLQAVHSKTRLDTTLQNMVANNRPKIEFFSEAQKNAQRDL